MTGNNPDTKVVVLPEAREEAYRMGYERFEKIPESERGEYWFDHYTGSVTWSNMVLPKLRCMAGATDRGHGTWTDHQEVVTVEFPEDRPIDGEFADSSHIHSELVDMFRHGAYDAVEGNDPRPEQYF